MSVILQKWQHVGAGGLSAPILPDGCRDLILRDVPGRRPVWELSVLQAEPLRASVTYGTRLTGFRLAPGAAVDEAILQDLSHDPLVAEGEILSAVAGQTRAQECIDALQSAASVTEAARSVGVAARSLQRVVVRETGFAPVFWQRLARARRAAVQVDRPLADVAADCGFSDQAHMSREFRRWFGVSPRMLRGSLDLRAQIAQPALATGEQISIR
ncbi:MAG: helix-turn-helix domain-containing protein [Cognatishimia sp.]